jgi:hypothetical protein
MMSCSPRKPLMMRIARMSLLAAVFMIGAQAQVRVSQMGSNPLLSAELFPQDMQEWPMYGFIYSPTYSKSPYWGRIDDPMSRPNGNYTSTGLTVDGFSHTAKIYSLTNGLSYNHRFSSQTVFLAGVKGDFDARYNGADGVLHGDNSSSPVPFDYSMLHLLGTGGVNGAGAFEFKGIPTGVRLQFGIQNTAALSHSMDFTKDNVEYSSDRATWGWTTSPCAHVFGLTGPEGDTWLQGDYATGPLYTVDLLAGATLPFGKSGLRFGTVNGHQDYYRWQADSNLFGADTIINENFIGHYEKQEWSRTTGGMATQLYTNWILREHGSFALNLFGRIGYAGLSHGEALSGNRDVTRDDKQASHGVSFDAAPNLTIPLGSLFNYIDVAVPLQYGFTRKSNTYMRWVGGGQVRTYRNSETSLEDENYWEPYSYANQHDVNAGVDISAMFPLVNSPTTKLGLGLQLLVNASATFAFKKYGTNTDNGSTVDFTVEQKRYDYEGRKQFSTGVKLQYLSGRSFGWFEITEPLLQAVRPFTRVTDATGTYEHEKTPLWLSMQGMRFSVYYTRQMSLSWLEKYNR